MSNQPLAVDRVRVDFPGIAMYEIDFDFGSCFGLDFDSCFGLDFGSLGLSDIDFASDIGNRLSIASHDPVGFHGSLRCGSWLGLVKPNTDLIPENQRSCLLVEHKRIVLGL